MKHRFHRYHSTSSLHGSVNHARVQDTSLPLVAEEMEEHQDGKGPLYDPKQDVFASLFVSCLDALSPMAPVELRRSLVTKLWLGGHLWASVRLSAARLICGRKPMQSFHIVYGIRYTYILHT